MSETGNRTAKIADAQGEPTVQRPRSKPLADVRAPAASQGPEAASKYDYYRRSESGRYGVTVEGPQPYESLKRRAKDSGAGGSLRKKTA